MSTPPESIRPGRTIAGKYAIEAMLGSGAMGTVWIATHMTLGSKVAVKLVSPDFARSAETQSRFLAEAKAAALLRSRYVVQMFDSGVTEDGSPYIVMEYLRGQSLEERIHQQGRLPLEQAVRILGQVAKGLSRAHAKGIVHRDLKPANIFLCTTEDGEEVSKILDFGIAKMDHDDKDYKATATGVIMGTPLFMSPEQARGLKTVDTRSDLYALGMCAYAALVGDVPFHAESFGDLVFMVCTRELPPTQEVAPWLPAPLDGWFRRACAKEQADRFASAEQMYDALLVAAQLNRPVQDLAGLPDSTTSQAGLTERTDRASGGFGDSRGSSTGHQSDPTSATVPFSSSEALEGSWKEGRRRSGTQPMLDSSMGKDSGATALVPEAGATRIAGSPPPIAQGSTHGGLVATDEALEVPERSTLPLLLGAALVVLAGLGGLGWWMSRTQPAEAIATEQPTQLPEAPSGAKAGPEIAAVPAPGEARQPVVVSRGAEPTDQQKLGEPPSASSVAVGAKEHPALSDRATGTLEASSAPAAAELPSPAAPSPAASSHSKALAGQSATRKRPSADRSPRPQQSGSPTAAGQDPVDLGF